MKVLITGFDPFGGEPINPAWEAVKRLPDNIDGVEIVKLQIPTVFKKSAKKLFENIVKYIIYIIKEERGDDLFKLNKK